MDVLQMIRRALQTECGLKPEMIQEDTHLLRDLGVDSLDLMNASFSIEHDCGVVLPVQEWLSKEYGEDGSDIDYFRVSVLCAYIRDEALRISTGTLDSDTEVR